MMTAKWIVAMGVGAVGFLYTYLRLRNVGGVASNIVEWIIGFILGIASLVMGFVTLVQLYSDASPLAVAIVITPPKWTLLLGPSLGLAIAGLVRHWRTKRATPADRPIARSS